MKLHYYPETDNLYIEFNAAPGTETREIAQGVTADVDAYGKIVGIDIDRASRQSDLTSIEAIGLPAQKPYST